MDFTKIPYGEASRARRLAGAGQCFLIQNNWDDYSYKTQNLLVYFDEEGTRHDIGQVKLMQAGMGFGYTAVEPNFIDLDDDYASLGQEQAYYENLLSLPEPPRLEILKVLKDTIWDGHRFQQFEQEPAFGTSLMRSVSERELQKFRQVLHEEPRLTSFHFAYQLPGPATAALDFEVTPHALPPTNIHVIIGRNGAGKTTLLKNISIVLRQGNRRRHGRITFFSDDRQPDPEERFANLITVAFSAFDAFDLPRQNDATRTGIQYAYVGLRKAVKIKGDLVTRNKTDTDLKNDFIASTLTCLRSSRLPRWRTAMGILEGEPGFAELGLIRLADLPQDEFEFEAGSLFEAASSGHKIVLLTMTRLIELVSERSLVLVDEPEAHLHPPLVSAFMQALSGLLASRNGVAILASHSPVVTQEVPATCVSMFFRDGNEVNIERPEIETFGENLGLLTREIFRVELTATGYHALLRTAVNESNTLDEAFEKFGNSLGAEGRAVLRSLWREKAI